MKIRILYKSGVTKTYKSKQSQCNVDLTKPQFQFGKAMIVSSEVACIELVR